MSYRAILFDAWDTIVTVGSPRAQRLQKMLEDLGLDFDQGRVQLAVMEADQQLLSYERPWVGTLTEEKRLWQGYCRTVLESLGVADQDNALAEHLAQGYLLIPWCYLYPEVCQVLEELRRRGYLLGIISHSYPSLLEALDWLGIKNYFKAVIISALVGVTKPDPRIYKIALQEMGISAKESLFIDDAEESVLAAMELGMTALLLDRKGQHCASSCRRIRKLDEVLTMIGT